MFIYDGKQEISEAIVKIINGYHQCCRRHTRRDLYHTMRKASSFIERTMRELKQRIKKHTYN